MHGGIGGIDSLYSIKDVIRPTKVKGNQIVADILWSSCEEGNKVGY